MCVRDNAKIFFLGVFLFVSRTCTIEQPRKELPIISIITSCYNADIFIEAFMKDIVQQTIFDQCELIIVNPASPGHEEPVIKAYMEMYQNIRYIKLDHDPGLYAVWNLAIDEAQGEFITNANVDDALAFNCYEVHLKALLEHPEVDLVYSDYYVTRIPNETFEHNHHYMRSNFAEYSWQALKRSCLPNNHPMWKRKMHKDYGPFDKTFKAGGDWEMWCRAGSQGAQFLKVPGVYGLYYFNPEGLSLKGSDAIREQKIIESRYLHIN